MKLLYIYTATYNISVTWGLLVINDTSVLTLRHSNHLAVPCSYLRQVLLVEVMNVCHCVKQPFCFLLSWRIRDLMSGGNPTPPPPLFPVPLQQKDRLPIFLSPVLGPGPWHLLDERSLVLSLSANVWVYWCAVTGPGWSYPTRIRASCCASSVSVCAPIATNRR